ncbi:polysaccharide biosynthesis/export family protein [Candidatus Nitrospira bockiana]
MKLMWCLVSVLILTVTTGCVNRHKDLAKDTAPQSNEFLLGPEDVLDVTVWRNQDLSRQVVVRPDGMISMPLIGDVQASGFTANQLAARIADRLKEYKENPSVTVSVKEVNSYSIYVLGEVTKPGKYQLKANTSVLQAIALAGGFTLFASKNKMQVVTTMPNGDGRTHEMRIPVRYDDLLSGKGERGNFILKAGDIVVVP